MAEAALDDVFTDDITLPAIDGYLLGATLFLPRMARRHAVLINSAIGVRRQVYRPFAAYLASRGCAVLTYDYRGLGDSREKTVLGRPKALVDFKASLSDWAALDVTAAVRWIRERYNNLPLNYIGHSFGGQALGLLPNNDEVSRALLIGAQAGSWKLMAAPERYRVYALLSVIGVPLTELIGYTPGWSGWGEDLPKGVFLQWIKWLTRERCLFDDPTVADLDNFSRFRGALRALCFADDAWATRSAVELLCSAFSAITPEIQTITPAQAAGRRIGHFGFFRPKYRNTLWRDAAHWIEAAG